MRTGFAVSATLALALLTGSPALAEEANPQVGDSCTLEQLLPAGLTCDNGVVAPTPAPSDPPAEPAPSDPPAEPVPTDPPADPVVVTPPVDPVPDPPVEVPPPTGGVEVPPVTGENPGTDPATPTDPTPGSPTAGGTTDEPGARPGTSLHASATTLDPASTKNSMLSAATVSNLAAGDLPTLAALRSAPVFPALAGRPLSAYTPSPLVANLPAATAAISAVQEPLLAVGDDAAAGGGFTLAGLSSKALPGLLVVLATALVAAVTAGNISYWQDRFGVRR